MSELTHFDEYGNAHMVNVGSKQETHRKAIATGIIKLNKAAFEATQTGTNTKGDVLGVARVAAILGAKKTADLIPLCHPLAITHLAVEFKLDESNLEVRCLCTVETFGKTGVEMEALTGVQIGLLTIYDMLKAIDKCMTITHVQLLEKTGGKN